MIFKSIRLKEGFFERAIIFSEGVNLIHSEKNSCGKTTLLRFMLYALGYNIPNTRKIKFDRCEVELVIECETVGQILLLRHGDIAIEATVKDQKRTFVLPEQQNDLHTIIFGTENVDILGNLLGAFYVDQEKGWTLLNRGIVIGSIHFKIEELIRGLSDCDCSELIRKEAQLSREMTKYTWLWIWTAIIALIKLINLISGFVVCRKFVAVHSIMNKITGGIMFCLPLFIGLKLPQEVISGICIIACAAATFAAIQEGHYIRTGKVTEQQIRNER